MPTYPDTWVFIPVFLRDGTTEVNLQLDPNKVESHYIDPTDFNHTVMKLDSGEVWTVNMTQPQLQLILEGGP